MDTGNGSSSDQFSALAPHYDELMDVVAYDAWADYVFLLFQIVQHDAQKCLDCACGTGNLSFELAKSKLEVVGVDIAPKMIEVAQHKVENSELASHLRFYEADLTDFDLGEKFDCATCLYDSLNYILDPEKLKMAFANIARHVEVGGVFVFDMNTPYALTQDLFTQASRDPRKRLHYNWQANYDPRTRITSVEMEFSRQVSTGVTEQFHEVHRERAYGANEVRALLETSGWEVERLYDAYTMNLPHAQSERWFWVARRVENSDH
ncbi:dTDP-3-amino-3,4,6-trideoxy-alpha-D-glucopyranose [Abditibacteriota bacterium]|nr:dTDP-3-amino-3,4,6-trideoxy-alpha-D-glucopyranose [Abditibacteriota bacterium]